MREVIRNVVRYARTDAITLGLVLWFLVSVTLFVFSGAHTLAKGRKFSSSLRSPAPVSPVIIQQGGKQEKRERKEERSTPLKPVF